MYHTYLGIFLWLAYIYICNTQILHVARDEDLGYLKFVDEHTLTKSRLYWFEFQCV